MTPRLAALVSTALFLALPARAQTPTTTELYTVRCSACHMLDGKAPIVEMNFADGAWKNGSKLSDVTKVIKEGVAGTAMLPFKEQLSEKEIEALAKYVRAFDKALKPDSSAPAKK